MGYSGHSTLDVALDGYSALVRFEWHLVPMCLEGGVVFVIQRVLVARFCIKWRSIVI